MNRMHRNLSLSRSISLSQAMYVIRHVAVPASLFSVNCNCTCTHTQKPCEKEKQKKLLYWWDLPERQLVCEWCNYNIPQNLTLNFSKHDTGLKVTGKERYVMDKTWTQYLTSVRAKP